MTLKLYNKKRNFKKTPEPPGKKTNKDHNLFVIQKHGASHLHYDFRLELDGILLSWAIPKGPSLDPSVKRLAIHVEDHPVAYGHFEGIIPKGEYGGGTVMLWDIGKWISLDKDTIAAYQKGHLKFVLEAEKLHGEWNLIQFKKEEKSWFLIKAKDKYAKSSSKYDITIKQPNSVVSSFDLDEIAENSQHLWTSKKGLVKKEKSTIKKNLKPELKKIKIDLKPSVFPAIIFPQLATLVDKAPEGHEWIHELKFDGYRMIAFKKNNNIRLMSRNNKEWTNHFADIVAEIKKISVKNLIFDGEIVLLDENQTSDFQFLQNSIGLNKPFIYYIFDFLYYDKYNLMSLSLIERKKILKQIILSTNADNLQFSDYIVGSGSEVYKNACEMGLEGIISKEIHGQYEEKRTRSWLKLKCSKRQEFVIGGYSPPQGSRDYFGSLYLGYYDKKGSLIYCGNVGTGFTQNSLNEIHSQLKKNIIAKNPFNIKPPGVTTAKWVKPVLVGEVEFSEWTSEGMLRHPSFKGLRSDKPANKITREPELKLNKNEAGEKMKTYKITSPDKLIYPESKIRKQDLFDYYEEIHEWILPYIVNRPLTIVRCPEDYKECFYQKHINKSTPKSLYGIKIKEKEKSENCIYIKDEEGLMGLVQINTLEIHPWGSSIENIEYPDTITIDLDPAPEIEWKKIVETAKRIKKYFMDFKLKSFVKTTGGKGLHVVIPIKPEHKWNVVKDFTRAFVLMLVENYPDEYVSEMSKAKRKGKIFVDYLRNQRGATAIAAYSTRARPGAPVSVPLDWDELTNNIKDTSYNIATVPKRLQHLKKDPWREYFKIKQSLNIRKK